MALNPAFESQSSRPLMLAFGYVMGAGDAFSTTYDTTGDEYGIYILGEGEWDGNAFFTPSTNGSLFNASMTVLVGVAAYYSSNNYLHFHLGAWSVIGAGTTQSSVGPDNGYDSLIGNFPTATPPQCFSGIAYVVLYSPSTAIIFGRAESITPTPFSPMGIYRSTRCRIFDVNGNVIGYGFTTNPAWHFVEVILRRKIKPQQPPLAGLTAAEKACFNWPSIVATAARNGFILPNGNPRFVGNYVFASDTTLTNILETILRVSRSYQYVRNGQIYLVGDDLRASVFSFSANHLVPNSMKLQKKDVSKAPNVFVPKYRDIGIPAVCNVTSVSVVNIGGGGIYQATFILEGLSPFLALDLVYFDGGSNPAMRGVYKAAQPISGGAVAPYVPNQVLAYCPTGITNTDSATGGLLGTNNARFSKRAPTGVLHRSAQLMKSIQAPGLATQPTITPVQYDCGNSTFDQTNRIMKFERDSSLGVDIGAGWTAPIAGTITAWLEAVDVTGKALIDCNMGDVITLDDWVYPENPGEYKITGMTVTAASGDNLGQIVLEVIEYIADAYTDASDNPGDSYATVDSPDLPFGTFPMTTAAWVLQATKTFAADATSGLVDVTISDLTIQWMGKTTPTLYTTAPVWNGLTNDTSYVLYIDDTTENGTTFTASFFAGVPPLAAMPAGRVIIWYGKLDTSTLSGTGSGGSGGTGGTGGSGGSGTSGTGGSGGPVAPTPHPSDPSGL